METIVMNPHMPRQEGVGDMRQSMDPFTFTPNPIAKLIDDSDKTAIQNYDKAASGGELVDGVHVVPGSMRFYGGIKEPADPVDEQQAIAVRQRDYLEPTWYSGDASVQVEPGSDPMSEENAVALSKRIRALKTLMDNYRDLDAGLQEPYSAWNQDEPSVQIIPDQPAPYGPQQHYRRGQSAE
jgi:hypothetical protein